MYMLSNAVFRAREVQLKIIKISPLLLKINFMRNYIRQEML